MVTFFPTSCLSNSQAMNTKLYNHVLQHHLFYLYLYLYLYLLPVPQIIFVFQHHLFYLYLYLYLYQFQIIFVSQHHLFYLYLYLYLYLLPVPQIIFVFQHHFPFFASFSIPICSCPYYDITTQSLLILIF